MRKHSTNSQPNRPARSAAVPVQTRSGLLSQGTACVFLLGTTLTLSACVSNSADQPTGSPGLSNNGAGPYIGGSAGSSIGGGPLGAGTEDNRAGAK